jgi:DNA-binding transcriptional regulator LsrR (DeoR family)
VQPALDTLPSDQQASQIRGVVVGILLDASGISIEPTIQRAGISRSNLEEVASRGGSILLAGAQEERLWPALAAIRAGVVSTIITDPDFARALLQLEADDRMTSRLLGAAPAEVTDV